MGNFSIPANNNNAVLKISSLGYVSQQVTVGNKKNIQVKLLDDVKLLDEVVVVGYGTQKKRDLTSSIATINSAEIANQSVGNAMAAIQGRMAGVQIVNSGTPGSSPSIRIRGTGSVYNSNPLYVVDGIIVNDISYLGPNDIESMSVLRDASASAIYGVQAANGVILVSTKKGTKDGKVRVSVNSYIGYKKPSQLMDMASSSEWITMWNERMDFEGTPAKKLDQSLPWANTNWFNEILTSSYTDNEDVNIQGGTEKSSFNIGFNHMKENGLIKNDNYQKNGLRANYDIKINKSLDAGMSLVVSSTQANPSPGGLMLTTFRSIPLFAPTDADGNFTDPTTINGFTPELQGNPSAALYYNHQWSNKINAFANTYVNFKFLKHFEIRSTLGVNPTFGKSISYSPKYSVSSNQKNIYNTMSKNNSENMSLSWDNILTFEKSFNQVHNLKLMAGTTYRENTSDYLSGSASDVIDLPEINSSFLFLTIGKANTTPTSSTLLVSDGGSKTVMLGYMGRVNYDFKNRYLMNFTMRADASSKFPANNRWGYFPSVGLGWVVSEENFMKDISAIDFMKIRAGWGLLGNANIPSNLYQPTTSNGSPVIFGPDQNTGTGPVTSAVTIKTTFNPFLTWEVVNETNIGLDITSFSNRLTTSLDWYHKMTTDAIFAITSLGSKGLGGSIYGNYANILNTGVELSLTWQDKIGELGYNANINGTYNQNTMQSISAGGASYLDRGDGGNNITPITRTMVGHPVGEFFGYNATGVYQNQAEIDATPHIQNTIPGHLIFEDVNKDGVIDDKDRTAIGNPNPPFSYGMNLGMDYKGFDVNAFFQGVAGNKIFNENRLLMYTTKNFDKAFYNNRWTGEGSSSTYPSVLIKAGDARTVSSFYVESGSYFRIKALQLGYSLPKSILTGIHIEKLRFYLNAENPYTFFKYNGFSPEVSSGDPLLSGVNNGVYPLSSVYSLGVNLIF